MPEKMTICKASKDSFLHFVTYDSEEEQSLATKRFIKWRETTTRRISRCDGFIRRYYRGMEKLK